MNWTPYGRNAILVRFADKPGEWAYRVGLSLSSALAEDPLPELLEFVPGYTTVLLEFDLSGGRNLTELAEEALDFLHAHARTELPAGKRHVIPVTYDGPDLERVAATNNISPERVVQFHTSTIYKVMLLGFAPGFPYLGELHYKLRTPRLPVPRTNVRAGSVAIGGEHTGIYPVESPGGWNVIGHTTVRLFDPGSAVAGGEEEAFLLRAGDEVEFVPL